MSKYILVLLPLLILVHSKLLLNTLHFINQDALHSPSKNKPKPKPNIRTIQFSGYKWRVRDTKNKLQGPGPNLFNSNQTFVWIDKNAYLHLKILKRNGKWYCSEITSQKSFGYGSYVYNVDKNFSSIDINTVVGLFNYLDDTHEIDIQISRWGQPKIANTQYVVQPSKIEGNQKRFTTTGKNGSIIHCYTWTQKYIYFQSFYADKIADIESQIGVESESERVIRQYNYTGKSNPRPSRQKTQINFWLYKSKQPSNGKDQEITIKEFKYLPLKK